MSISFKNATIDDLPRIVAIYNATIPSRVVTADLTPVTVEERLDWFRHHNEHSRPLWVVTNEEEEIMGWASFNSFYGRPAYSGTAELSIYIDEDYRGKGLGKEILQYCIDQSSALNIKTLLGFIFAHNEPSLALFRNFGFGDWGTFPGIAELDGVERTLIIVGKRVS